MCVFLHVEVNSQHWVSSSVILYTTVFNFNFMCMSIFPVCISMNTCAWCPKRPKKVLDHLELELQMVLSRDVGSGNQTWLLCMRSQNS